MLFKFDDFALDTGSLELKKAGQLIEVEPQVFSLLVCLIENRNRVVSKDELIEMVWEGRIVSDSSLNTRINTARKAVGDDGKAQAVIKTFPRRGFRWVADVEEGIASKETDKPSTTSLIAEKPAIAVLPFENLSDDREQEYFADGVTEDIISAISRNRQFLVIARNSTFTYKGQAKDIKEIANELNVQYVLEGSVRKSGNQIRISAQLIEGATGVHLWSGKYDRELEDLFAVQDEITQTVVGALDPELTDAEIKNTQRKSPENYDAWDYYLRGLTHFYARTIDDFEQALKYFERAIECDPNLGVAYSLASETRSFLTILSSMRGQLPPIDRRNGLDLAEGLKFALKAIEIDGDDSHAWVSLGLVHLRQYNPEKAILAFEKAIDLNPSDSEAYRWLGQTQSWSGYAAEALPNIELSLKISPRGPLIGPIMSRKAECYLFMEQFEEALIWSKRAVQEPSLLDLGHVAYISILGHLGRTEEAEQAIKTLFGKTPDLSLVTLAASPMFKDENNKKILYEGLKNAGFPEE
jgi:TolB-like protein